VLASIIVRTYNEQRYLGALLRAIANQEVRDLQHEVLIVDSGSTDDTVAIAEENSASVLHIPRSDFSFGRSLNWGCSRSHGDILVFVSGHCVPTRRDWLQRLIDPLIADQVALTYGRQLGGPESKFSEHQLFAKFYPETSRIPQQGFFCNNANAALRRATWEEFRFDEALTGLEDLHLSRRLYSTGRRIGYVADAPVFHYHHETWSGVRRRYERESIALQHIMPEIHITFFDFLRYFVSAVGLDLRALFTETPQLWRLSEIVLFRFMQFWGSYRGNHEHRQLSQQRKEMYFYPK